MRYELERCCSIHRSYAEIDAAFSCQLPFSALSSLPHASLQNSLVYSLDSLFLDDGQSFVLMMLISSIVFDDSHGFRKLF